MADRLLSSEPQATSTTQRPGVSSDASSKRPSRHLGVLLGSVAFSSLISFKSLANVAHLSLSQPDSSHLLLIPVLAVWLVYQERSKILSRLSFELKPAVPFFLVGIILLAFTWSRTGTQQDWYLAGSALALVLLWIGSFVASLGTSAARSARFPLLLLLLLVPIPNPLLDYVIYYLQRGSAEVTALLFDLSGFPVLREGFSFQLPRYSIEVAKECSGIRSSMALLILTLIVAHFYLRTLWRQTAFVVIGLVVMIIKNGVRIFTLSALANYVDPGFLFGDLHRQGGVVFFLLGLLLLWPVLRVLVRSERKTCRPEQPAPG